jgi:hypothetical protein
MEKMYVLYKGEEVVCVGTAREIAEKQNIKLASFKFYGSNCYKQRIENSENSQLVVELNKFTIPRKTLVKILENL